MRLLNYPLPTPTMADFAFPTYDTDARLLDMAREYGFDKRSNPYNELFTRVFFEGCGGFEKKQGIEEEYYKKVLLYFKCLARSFAPKHEHKTAVCAFLLSEIFEPTHIPKDEQEK